MGILCFSWSQTFTSRLKIIPDRYFYPSARNISFIPAATGSYIPSDLKLHTLVCCTGDFFDVMYLHESESITKGYSSSHRSKKCDLLKGDGSSRRLVVGPVAHYMTESHVASLFFQFGTLSNICLDSVENAVRFGVVTFLEPRSAKMCLKTSNCSFELTGSKTKLCVTFNSVNNRDENPWGAWLILHNVAPTVNNKYVVKMLEKYGQVASIGRPKPPLSKEIESRIFAQMTTIESACYAYFALNGRARLPGSKQCMKVFQCKKRSSIKVPDLTEISNIEVRRTKLFVGGIPRGTSIAELHKLFVKYGDVTSINIISGKSMVKSALVVYSNSLGAENAIKRLHGRACFDQQTTGISVKFAKIKYTFRSNCESKPMMKIGPRKVFVGNLKYSVSEVDLVILFAKFGKIDEIFMMREEDGQSKGSAFIIFGSQKSASQAIIQLQGVVFCGRRLVINLANRQ